MNLLIAYPYVAAPSFTLLERLNQVGNVRWLLDSGAFTAWKSGKPIQLDDYCAFLRNLPVQPWRYFALDVVGDGAATLRNYRVMLERGFKPVPVFTRGESLDVLDGYYETSDVVALGGLVSQVNRPKPYLKHLHAHLAGRPYHILGFTALNWIKYLKPYSVDSSSWLSAARYGQVYVYMGRGKLITLARKELEQHRHDDAVADRVRQLGFAWEDLFKDAAWTGHREAAYVSACSWIWLALEMEARLGTRLFLATTTPYFYLAECYARALHAAGHLNVFRQNLRRTA
jgi:hypothetical protein